MIFTMPHNKIFRLFMVLVFSLSIFYNLPIHASDTSSEDTKEPPAKRRKLTQSSDSDEELLHAFDPSAPKSTDVSPNPNVLELSTTTPPLTSPSATPNKSPVKFTSFQAWAKLASPSSLHAEEKTDALEPLHDSFYIFNVGQGNAQLAIYAEGVGEAFAVLYDCGSSAETVNSKVLKIQSSNKEPKPFLVRKIEEPKKSTPHVLSTVVLPLEEEKVSSTPMTGIESTSSSLESSDHSFSNEADTESPKAPIIRSIKDTLAKVKNLFVILSHPDRDHINLLGDSLPPTTNVLLILCGNFFVENANADLKKDISELFSFIAKRTRDYPTRTHFTLPYFWPSEHKTPYSTLNYQDIKSFLLTSSTSKKLPLEMDILLPKGFQGDFLAFLQRMQQVDPQSSVGNTSQAPFYVNFSKDNRLKNIYIWSINQISDNINNHSPVISLRMPNLEKTFICTGDAGPEVFLKIQKKVSKQIIAQPIATASSAALIAEEEPIRRVVDTYLHGEASQPYIIMLMLPHHGAENNLSYSMLDLFAPHILGISAGAGSMYRHPSTDLIKHYKKAYKERTHLQERKTQLWKFYETDIEHYYLTFKDETKTKESKKPLVRARLNRLQDKKLPVLSTGIAGTIHITKEGFYGQFTDHFKYNDQIYSIEFSEAICVNDSTSPKITGDCVEISAKGQNAYISSEIKQIKYEGVIFHKSEQKNWLEKKVFLSEGGAQLLVSLDIKQKGKDNKTIQKFYLADIAATDN